MPRLPLSPWQLHCRRWSKGCGSSLCGKAHKIVLGRGQVPADVFFVGEAPGVSEDVQGLPFVGPAGFLLNRIIDKALGSTYTHCIGNLVGCMPQDDTGSKSGAPDDDDVKQCSGRLQELHRICNPKLVVAVGQLAEHWLRPGMKHTIPLLGLSSRGDSPVRYESIVHPAWILRLPLVRQPLEERRCIVRIQAALEELTRAPATPTQTIRTADIYPDDNWPDPEIYGGGEVPF